VDIERVRTVAGRVLLAPKFRVLFNRSKLRCVSALSAPSNSARGLSRARLRATDQAKVRLAADTSGAEACRSSWHTRRY